ncbi:hypothetical protein B0H14DRAFT_3172028 [Mycena olivaceomarginata]|nr:hypothetical protein B0H14DRAFT_3172028 [Mycena olivaceomarginata]
MFKDQRRQSVLLVNLWQAAKGRCCTRLCSTELQATDANSSGIVLRLKAGMKLTRWRESGIALASAELQRIIFEIAALSHLITTPNLMLIAWRVELLLYRVLSSVRVKHTRYPAFPSARLKFCSKSSRKSRHFFNKFAESELKTVLTACIRVTNLVSLYSSGEPLAGFRCLQRFTIDVDAFLTSCATDSIPVIHTVMHFELLTRSVPTRASGASYIGVWIRRVCPLTDNGRFVCIEQKIGLQEIWLHGKDLGQDYWARAGAYLICPSQRSETPPQSSALKLLVNTIHSQLCSTIKTAASPSLKFLYNTPRLSNQSISLAHAFNTMPLRSNMRGNKIQTACSVMLSAGLSKSANYSYTLTVSHLFINGVFTTGHIGICFPKAALE